MNIIFAGYREWTFSIVSHLERHPRVKLVKWVSDNDKLLEALADVNHSWDVVLFAGWSTPPTQTMVDMGVPFVTEHPAVSDKYTPGTPLQNQILDGVRYTKHRLVKVGVPELSPHLWCYEVDIDLTGNMSYVLSQMEMTTKHLFNLFCDNFPNIAWYTWPEVPADQQFPRRTPSQSKITHEDILTKSTQQLYDKMRCLEHPYPNAYIEDDFGILYFEKVKYKSKI